ncbi:hypothetical protein HPB48_012622 [Haemaphysalis longicornis]|uniref:EB domain-containing protein n=1 Tax=Haemaphysalis longicornis TaxID=44386 RepID=A0A9J6G1R5_HAELO|nr:hypothetical protein HPB48_012622 [Haemaphysalis longicornis]
MQKVDLHLSFMRLDASTLRPGERVNVACRIQLLGSRPAAVVLSAGVRAGSHLLHSGFGDPCKAGSASGGARMCVGEATVCDPRLGHGLCVCDPYHAARYEEMRVCLLRKTLGEPCLLDEHCDGRTQRCHRNLCVCQVGQNSAHRSACGIDADICSRHGLSWLCTFYRRSYRPAVMIERTGSSWDFFPTVTTKRESR